MQWVREKTIKLANLNVLAELPPLEGLLSTLCGCRDEGNLAFAMHVHKHACCFGLDLHENVGNHVIRMFVDCGSLDAALNSFMRLEHRNVYSWTALMQGLVQCEKWQKIFEFYEQMKAERVNPCSFTFVALLKACGGSKDVETAQAIHSELAKAGHECVYTGTALVDMYVKCGLLNEARNIFQTIPARNVVAWNCLLAGYADYGTSAESLRCLEQMRADGIHPDVITFVSILKVCVNRGTIKIGQEIHSALTKQGNETNSFAGNVLVDMYARHGFVLEAQNVFDRFPGRNFVSWTSLIAGYVEHGQDEKVFSCFEQLQFENEFLDAAMFSCILKMCGSIGAIKKGLELHMDLHKKGVESNVYVGSTLVDMYAKCGHLLEARDILNKLSERNVVSWNAMINGCGINEKSDSAVEAFEDMQKEGVKPDAATFLCLLAACSRASLVSKGQEYFQMMRENHQFLPNFRHLMCIVDLFARSGQLREAGKCLNSLPCHPSRYMWTSLLSASKTYVEEKAGQQCFDQLNQSGSSTLAGPSLIIKALYSRIEMIKDAYPMDNQKKQSRTLNFPALVPLEVI